MFGMARAGMAERWTLFAGALLAVSLGVALVQSSLLCLISAALLKAPPGSDPVEQAAYRDNVEAAVAMLGITLGIATFLAAFVISSTFAFTVNQRRADLALLRLVGGSRGQLRRLLLGEALLLGVLGAAVGVPGGLGVMAVQSHLLKAMDFVPQTFVAQWRPWILAVSFGTGTVLAIAGAMVAAHRAARVQPLEALRDVGAAARVMTAPRWIAGLVFLGGAVAMVIVAAHVGPAGATALATTVAMPAAIALAAFAPLLVPVVGWMLPVGELARANLRDARRRSASVAAPLIVLVGFVIGISAASASFTGAGVQAQRRDTHADFVVDAPVTASAVPGADVVSTELTLPVRVTTGHGEDEETDTYTAAVIDPVAYGRVHGGHPLPALHGREAIAGPGGGLPGNGTIGVRTLTTDLGQLSMAGSVPETINGGAELLLPSGVVPATELTDARAVSYVALAPGADRAAAKAALATFGPVTDVGTWLRADAKQRSDINSRVSLVILGLSGLYALIGVVNSVVIGAASRPREFAAARLAGLTRGQVVRLALRESWAVTAAGILLGALAALAPCLAALAATTQITGHATLDLPWRLTGAVVAAAIVVTGLASLITTASATRPAPVTLLGARE